MTGSWYLRNYEYILDILKRNQISSHIWREIKFTLNGLRKVMCKHIVTIRQTCLLLSLYTCKEVGKQELNTNSHLDREFSHCVDVELVCTYLPVPLHIYIYIFILFHFNDAVQPQMYYRVDLTPAFIQFICWSYMRYTL